MWTLIFIYSATYLGSVQLVTDFSSKEKCEVVMNQLITKYKPSRSDTIICVEK